jgi:nicotinate-nucleotide pyrophosphorylase (carboxylating)
MSFRTIQGGAAARRGVARLPHDRSDLLWSGGEPTALFLDSIDRWVDAMVADEHGGGDGPDRFVEASITAKAVGLLCGRPIADRLLERHFPECSARWGPNEGGSVREGDTVVVLYGPAGDILRLERVLLNLLGRLSGIATNTSKWAAAAHPILVAATRKTEWGVLDKWAVLSGGGLTHRLDRGDALMLKENDLTAMTGGDEGDLGAIQRVVSSIDMDEHAGFTVVEVQSVEQSVAAAAAWDSLQNTRGGDEKLVLLLDNMGATGAGEAQRALSKAGLRRCCILEGSGGVFLESLGDWTESGVDLVSSSALNRGVAPLDMSMLIEGGE